MRTHRHYLTLALVALFSTFAALPASAAQPRPVRVTSPMEELPNIYNYRMQSDYPTYLTRYSGVAVTPHVIATVAHGLFDDEDLVWTSNVQRIIANNSADYSYTLGKNTIYGLQQKVWTSYASRVAKDKSGQGQSNLQSFNADFGAVYSDSPLSNHYAPTEVPSATPYNLLTNGRNKKLMGFPLTNEIPYADQGYLHEIDLGTRKFEQVTDGKDDDRMPFMIYVIDGPDSYGGNSGGPVFYKDENGKWQVIAIFLGGSGAIYVRAIDKQASDLIALADQAAGGVGAGETKPTIFNQPSDFTYPIGEPLSIDVSASISPSTSITWHKDGALLTGKNSLVLPLDSNSASTPGEYWMTASNAKGSTQSAHIKIDRHPPPTIIQEPRDTYLPQNAQNYLTINFESAYPGSTTLEWFKNGELIDGTNNSAHYALRPETDYSGTYTFKITNPSGSVTSRPIQVGTYSVDSFLSSQPIELGATDIISLPIQAPAEISYRWTTPRGVIDTAIPQLPIADIAATDFANYTLHLVAPDGNLFNRIDFSVRAKQPTVLLNNQISRFAPFPFDRLSLQVAVSGDYSPYQIQWYHDGAILEGANDLQLALYPIQASDNGSYHYTLVDSRGDSFESLPIIIQMDESGIPRNQFESIYRFLPSSGKALEASDSLNASANYNAFVTQDTWLFQHRSFGYNSSLSTLNQVPNFSSQEYNLVDVAACSWGFATLHTDGAVKIYTDFQFTTSETLSPNTVDFAMNELGPITLQSDGTIHLLDTYRPAGDSPDTHPDWQRIIRIEAEGDKLLALRSDQTLLLWNFTTAQSTTLSQGKPIRDFDIAAENIPVLLEDDTILQLGHQHTLDGVPANETAPDLHGKSPLSVHATANFTFARLRSNKVHIWGKAPPLQPGGQPLTFSNATYIAEAVFTSRHAYALLQNYASRQAYFHPTSIAANTGDFFVARLAGPLGKLRKLQWQKNGIPISQPSHGAIYSESASADDLATYLINFDRNVIFHQSELDIRVGEQPGIYFTPQTFTATEGSSFKMPIGINLAKENSASIQWFKDGKSYYALNSENSFLYLNAPTLADSGTYHFVLTLSDGSTMQSDPIHLIVSPRITFETWTQQHGLEAPDDTWLADPDDDGLINYFEYLLDDDPLKHGPPPIQYTYDGSFPVARLSLPYRVNGHDFHHRLNLVNPRRANTWETDVYSYANHYGPNTIDIEIPIETEDDKSILLQLNVTKY